MARFWSAGLIAAWFVAAQAAAGGLPPAKDLAADAQAARRDAMPIVLFFSADSCPYCAEVAGLHLEPLHARGVYAGRALFRIADVERHTPVRGFDGRRLTQAELAGRYRVSFTPYIMFLDPDGNELVPPLIGYSSPDFYSGYLESAIEAAIEKLRARRVALRK